MVFALSPDTWAKVTALIIFIIAALTDLIDGKWARKKKIVTDLGAFLDPLADKMLVNLAFLVLVYLNVVPLWAGISTEQSVTLCPVRQALPCHACGR